MLKNDKIILPLIGIVSIVVLLLVSLLMLKGGNLFEIPLDISSLPLLNASINFSVAVLLVSGVWAIKNGKTSIHKTLMLSALTLSVLFLVSYVIYHSGTGHVKYGGEGVIKIIYLLVLLTHIVLSAIIVPMALITVYWGLTDQLDKHKKIAKFTFPVWLYVALSGVLVYLMAHPFNPGL